MQACPSKLGMERRLFLLIESGLVREKGVGKKQKSGLP